MLMIIFALAQIAPQEYGSGTKRRNEDHQDQIGQKSIDKGYHPHSFLLAALSSKNSSFINAYTI
jgi:hypothetical protein